MARRYIPLPDELINRAQHADIVEYLKQRGEEVYREGRCYVWKAHDSVRIEGFKWYQNSTQKGGSAVAFVMHFFHLHFTDAVAVLTGENIPSLQEEKSVKTGYSGRNKNNASATKKEPSKFVLPDKAENHRRVYAYLTKTRDLDADILSVFLDSGAIYEDEKHNAVFVGYDNAGIPRSAHQKGTNTYAQAFKRCVAGSNLNYPFAHVKGGDTLYVFEAAVDMLSWMCMHRSPELFKQSYISIGGLHINPVHHFLDTHANIKQVFFCTDNDVDGKLPDGTPHNHGQEFAKKHAYNLQTKGYVTGILTPQAKDWNEDLKEFRRNQ